MRIRVYYIYEAEQTSRPALTRISRCTIPSSDFDPKPTGPKWLMHEGTEACLITTTVVVIAWLVIKKYV